MLDPQVEEIDRNFLVVEVALAVVEVAAVVDVDIALIVPCLSLPALFVVSVVAVSATSPSSALLLFFSSQPNDFGTR